MEVTLLPAILAAVLAILDTEIRDSREPIFLKDEFKAAPVGLCTMHIDLLFDGDRLTLCTGAKRPCLGRHSKYLINLVLINLDLIISNFKFTYFDVSKQQVTNSFGWHHSRLLKNFPVFPRFSKMFPSLHFKIKESNSLCKSEFSKLKKRDAQNCSAIKIFNLIEFDLGPN